MKNQLTSEDAQRVLEVVDAGLVRGLGRPVPGRMCVEAAVSYALGLGHSDVPSCVGSAVRTFKIAINDAPWSSPKSRAQGMRRVAVAQLGSDTIDQQRFIELVIKGIIQQIVPLVLEHMRSPAAYIPLDELLCRAALECRQDGTLIAARRAVVAVRRVVVERPANEYTGFLDSFTPMVWNDVGKLSTTTAAIFAGNPCTSAAFLLRSQNTHDSILTIAAKIAEAALVELDCPGTKWLYLCDNAPTNTNIGTNE